MMRSETLALCVSLSFAILFWIRTSDRLKVSTATIQYFTVKTIFLRGAASHLLGRLIQMFATFMSGNARHSWMNSWTCSFASAHNGSTLSLISGFHRIQINQTFIAWSGFDCASWFTSTDYCVLRSLISSCDVCLGISSDWRKSPSLLPQQFILGPHWSESIHSKWTERSG
jgi:hypothetical protein